MSLAAAFLLLAPWTATAAEPRWAEQVDSLVAPYVDAGVVTGMTVGILADGRQHVAGYGRLSQARPQTPDGETVYEIGSITKVFTGLLLGDAVVRGRCTLQQPVAELLPGELPNFTKGNQAVQLWHLATHTAGMPRLPANLQPSDPHNPYADYSAERLGEFLPQIKLRGVPGQATHYSNLGMGLLGHVLASQAGVPYETLVKRRITEPLGMNSTGIALSESMRARLAPPHADGGIPDHNWDFQALAGAGALRSTGNDLLRFMQAHLDPPAGPPAKAIELAWQAHWNPAEATEFAMGLGWHLARDGQTRWHNGQTGGYHSMLLVNRQRKTAVVVLANTASDEVDRLAEELMRMVSGHDVSPRQFPKQVKVPPELLQRYVGRFMVTPDFILTVTQQAEGLMVQATGQPPARIYPSSESKWFYRVVDAQISFQVDAQGRCHGLVLHQNGRDLPAQRMPEDEGKAGSKAP